MSDALSFAEINEQHVEPLPARTVMSMSMIGAGGTGGAGGGGGPGGAGGHGGVSWVAGTGGAANGIGTGGKGFSIVIDLLSHVFNIGGGSAMAAGGGKA